MESKIQKEIRKAILIGFLTTVISVTLSTIVNHYVWEKQYSQELDTARMQYLKDSAYSFNEKYSTFKADLSYRIEIDSLRKELYFPGDTQMDGPKHYTIQEYFEMEEELRSVYPYGYERSERFETSLNDLMVELDFVEIYFESRLVYDSVSVFESELENYNIDNIFELYAMERYDKGEEIGSIYNEDGGYIYEMEDIIDFYQERIEDRYQELFDILIFQMYSGEKDPDAIG